MIILLAAAVLPAVYLLSRVYRMDTIEKEPFSLLRKLLLWGAISGVPAALVESLLTGVLVNLFEEGTVLYNLFAGFVVAALVEESFKFFFLYKFTFRTPDFNYRFDGVVYAVFVSTGFAILENILYVFQGGIGVAITRALLALPLHAACGVYMGIAYGQQKVNSLYKPASFGSVAAACLPVPILIHGFYDFCAFMQTWPFTVIFIGFVALVFILTLKNLQKASREDRPVNEVTIDAQ